MNKIIVVAVALMLSACALLEIKQHELKQLVNRNYIEVGELLFNRAHSNWSQEFSAVQDRITVTRVTLADGSIEISAVRWNPELAGSRLPFITLRVSEYGSGASVLIKEQRSFINQDHIYLDQAEQWLIDLDKNKQNQKLWLTELDQIDLSGVI